MKKKDPRISKEEAGAIHQRVSEDMIKLVCEWADDGMDCSTTIFSVVMHAVGLVLTHTEIATEALSTVGLAVAAAVAEQNSYARSRESKECDSN